MLFSLDRLTNAWPTNIIHWGFRLLMNVLDAKEGKSFDAQRYCNTSSIMLLIIPRDLYRQKTIAQSNPSSSQRVFIHKTRLRTLARQAQE
jgi:hypothetical protein